MTLTPGKVVLSNPLTCTNTPKGENKLYSDAKGVVPSLDLRFAEGKTLNDYMTATPLVDHQRSMFGSNLSPGTFVNSNGLIETAKFNALTANSEVFSTWIVPSTSTATTTSPFNTTAASIDNASALSITVNDPSAVTFSGYFKQGSSRYVYLRSVNWGSVTRIYFDLQLGQFVRQDNLAAPVTDTFATSVGNGWYRCGFTLDSTGDSVGNLQITATDSSTNTSTVGYVFAFGIQVEEGPVSTYIPTTTNPSAAPRFDHDPTTGESLGLLIEESRTNLIPYSENFDIAATPWFNINGGTGQVPVITPNAAVSPDGTTNATKIDFDVTGGSTGGDVSLISQTYSASATDYTLSAWIKADSNFNLVFDHNTGTTNTVSVTTEWQRITYTKLNASGTKQVRIGLRADRPVPQTATIYIWGAQLEAGAFPTSYISTTGTALTRSADVASITGSNFSSWYNQSEGTTYLDFSRPFAPVSSKYWYSFSGSNVITERHSVYQPANLAVVATTNDGTTQATFSITGSFSNKNVYAYKLNDYAACVDGGTVNTDTTATVPAIVKLNIGSFGNGFEQPNGTIARLTYFPDRLPDSSLQTMTTP